MSPTRVAKLQKKAQYCHTCCSNLRGDCTGADQVERRADILGRQGQVATPAAFYLGLCRLRGNLSLPAPATVILQAGNSSMRLRPRQAGNSILRQRASAGGLFFFEAKKNRIGHGIVAATTAAGGTAILCDEENWNRTRHRCGNACAGEQFYLQERWHCSDS